MSVEAAYVGNKGTHVFAGNGPDYNLNQPTNDGFTSGFTTNERRPFHSCTAPTGAGTCYFGMPFGWSQDLRYHANDSSNHYNALQTKIEKRFSQGYTFTAHYTLSRNTNFDSNGYNFHRDVTEGVADFNRTHVFVLNGLWELPFGQGKRWLADVSKAWNYLVGGWQINTTTNWSSGLPFSFSYNSCGADIDTSAGPCRPNRIGKVNYGGRNQWFEISSITNLANGQSSGPWERPAFGEFGDSERNEGRGPRFFNTDLSVFKNFAITEIVKGQFRFEVFNIFNNVNLGTPGVFFQEFGSGGSNCVDCNAASDGRITGLGGRMRRAQFAIKLSF
jgi:hypothetical protein